jgi:hypothetical protein
MNYFIADIFSIQRRGELYNFFCSFSTLNDNILNPYATHQGQTLFSHKPHADSYSERNEINLCSFSGSLDGKKGSFQSISLQYGKQLISTVNTYFTRLHTNLNNEKNRFLELFSFWIFDS